jgi:GNAT superfamily N-acetyltransferase
MRNDQGIKIRNATENDVSEIAAIVRGLQQFAHINEEPPLATEQRIRHHFRLCAANDSHTVYVAEHTNGQVLGYTVVHWLPYLLLKGTEGYVSELFVRVSAQGRGIGRLLLETVKTEAKQRGCYRLSLLNMRNRESYQRDFYKKVGWEEREHAANFILPLE